MITTKIPQEKALMYPWLRENVWHIDPDLPSALLITSQGEYEVPSKEALRFMEMRTYCTGQNSIEEIADKSGMPAEEVTSILKSLNEIDLLRSPGDLEKDLTLPSIRASLVKGCEIWSGELKDTYIGNEFAKGELPKTVLLGWQLEMYHYVKDFPYAIEHAAKHASGKLKEVLLNYTEEEKGHQEFVVQTLMNLGLSRKEVETSIPLLSTRMIGFLMRELFELEPSSALMVAAMIEADDLDEVGLQVFKEKLHEDYGVGISAFDPFFEHQKVDWNLGHAQLLSSNLDLIEVEDLGKLDQIVNKIHDLKHAFDLQGLEIKAYYTQLNGKYMPRQPVEFLSI